MPVLAEGSFLPRAHIVRKRSSCRPQQSARGFGLEITNLSHGNPEFPWVSGILPSVYPRFLQDRQADDKAPSEGSQVYLDIRLRGSFPAVEVEAIQLEPDLTYQEHPIKILDQKERATRR